MNVRESFAGFPTRRAFEEALQRHAATARQTQGPLGVLILDLDHLMIYNDSYGHEAGDAALGTAATLLRAQQGRREDLNWSRPDIFYLGGAMFAVILPERTHEEAAVWAERVRGGDSPGDR